MPDIPLFGAARLGSGKITYEHIVCRSESPNQQDEYGNTPLHYGVHLGSKEVSNILLEYNANPNTPNNKGKTPLHLAAQWDHDYLVRRLLMYGADPNKADNNGNTPLHLAACNAHKLYAYRIVHDLLCNGADPNIKNQAGQTPLILAQQAHTTSDRTALQRVPQQRHIDHIVCMLQPLKSTHQQTLLDRKYIRTAKTTRIDKMKRLVQCPSINANQQVGTYKRSALMYAARTNRTQMVRFLVQEVKVDKLLTDVNGKTALDYARKHNNPELHALLAI